VKHQVASWASVQAGRTARLLEANLSHILDIAMDHFALIVAHLERAVEQFLPKRLPSLCRQDIRMSIMMSAQLGMESAPWK